MSFDCKTDKIQVNQLKDNIKNSKIIENQKTDSIPTQSDILNTQNNFISKEKNLLMKIIMENLYVIIIIHIKD